MIYNVSHLLQSSVGSIREDDLDAGEVIHLDDAMAARLLGGHVRFDRTNTGILARGHVDAAVAMACSRCLDPVDIHVASDFAEEFEPTIDVATGRPLPLSGNDLAFAINEQHLLDLGEALRQNLLASLPIQPLCQDDCQGLCPECGANRNAEGCDCAPPDTHRPLAALADLLKATDDENAGRIKVRRRTRETTYSA